MVLATVKHKQNISMTFYKDPLNLAILRTVTKICIEWNTLQLKIKFVSVFCVKKGKFIGITFRQQGSSMFTVVQDIKRH